MIDDNKANEPEANDAVAGRVDELVMLPCPFCGAKAELHNHDGFWYAASCTEVKKCEGGPVYLRYVSAQLAVSAWNKREKSSELRRLLNKINKITSCHRHGTEISDRDLTELSNYQVSLSRQYNDD